ncbi:urease accessory protein UreF [Kushneria sinocarnis]|uniref:urease accessory protein UreF n=1 Tax=Kushneria sinocarnis TaxID=595502 RepID=UPI003CCC8CDA
MQLVSPALPVGAFAWSQGLESAFELDWVRDEASLGDWLEGVLFDGIGRLELPLLPRLLRAWRAEDVAALVEWNDWLLAARETRELLEEDVQLGHSLRRWLEGLGLAPEPGVLARLETLAYVTLFARAARMRGLDERTATLGFGWAWLENQLGAACKALRLGQSAAQRVIERLRPRLIEAVDIAETLADDELGPVTPGVTLASALHETQYSRLFRS